eukprot:g1749.t1
MGFLEEATPMSWAESQKHFEALKANGIEQFLTIWRQHSEREDQEMLWGDEQETALRRTSEEYALVEVGPGADDVRLLLRAHMALQTLKGRSEAYEAKVTSSALWSPEMGNHMVEGVTKPPYQASLDEIDLVEERFWVFPDVIPVMDVALGTVPGGRKVANGLGSERGWQGLVWTFANFPLLGTPGGQAPAQPASFLRPLAASGTRGAVGNRTGGFARRLASVRELYDRRSWAEGYAPDACQLEVIEKLDNLSNSLSAKQVPKGLYLYGGVGTGKPHGGTGLGPALEDRSQDYFARCPILAFDEAHVLNIGDALLMKAFMEAYFRAGGVVVATSNVAPDDLYASGVNRETFMPFIDTLRQSCEFYEMRGREDYRMRESQTRRLRGSYLWGPNMASVEAADDVKPTDFPSLMETMNGSDLPRLAEALEIDVGFGRTLRCPSAWTDGTKTELCRRATGPSEWLGLAENVDAILVTGVPHFEAHDEDAARRFITFVDVAYDTKRFLGITAESSPEEIFGEFLTKKFRSQGLLCDVALIAPESKQLAHQVILAASSGPLKEHIFSQHKDQCSPAPELSLPPSALEIQLENVPSDSSLSNFLDGIYAQKHEAERLLQLQELQSKGHLCDLLLSVGTQHVAAHQVVLAAHCEAFRNLIMDGRKQLGLDEKDATACHTLDASTYPMDGGSDVGCDLELRGVTSAEAVSILLDFLYGRPLWAERPKLTMEVCKDVVHLATELKLPALKEQLI